MDLYRPLVPADCGAATPIFGPIMPNHLNMPKPQILDALLTASGLLNLYFYPKND